MAKKTIHRNRRRTYGSNTRRGNAKELRDFARKMGLVQRGLKNPDSQISESYNSGLEKHSRKPKKTLF